MRNRWTARAVFAMAVVSGAALAPAPGAQAAAVDNPVCARNDDPAFAGDVCLFVLEGTGDGDYAEVSWKNLSAHDEGVDLSWLSMPEGTEIPAWHGNLHPGDKVVGKVVTPENVCGSGFVLHFGGVGGRGTTHLCPPGA
ncbi:hypothetical protein [Amycolatopsis silviterrae]|uniref:Uncharacterized protein n=1 Tax=Amycolatopsis silviterrae TaxID=1656914 RepID=A0ABW5H4A4_9PSEU